MAKRTPFEREQALNTTTKLHLQGKTQAEIAEIVGVSQQQVSKDIKEIKRRWRKDSAINMDEAKQKELARIDELERISWLGFENSCGQMTKTQTSYSLKEGDKEVTTVEFNSGNPAFLFGVMHCIKQRCKILGIEAPEKQEITSNTLITIDK